jgi:hypothetical protein
MIPRPINRPGLGAIHATGRYFDRGNSGTCGKFATKGYGNVTELPGLCKLKFYGGNVPMIVNGEHDARRSRFHRLAFTIRVS